ncbi:cobalamin biosynthesis protein CobD [Metallosphaera yellowstonensis MK1]|jgi:adenosylcobinamide-phosphate synthase (EC 6.3.1.10)|uniref:Probable cobalamin biosynthesis protein CobD n=1 Tax=Metallosphaera yellowstonensis MK1 TaxID=671065 RepID=H2C668_9CREN|nr:cobalamin biosynthesis protein [Metallosphaera yellowstonensis]EHP69295.1 cobalamin biosynthesis protein CobD [Metallosphaera yellowstonensis MK1]
MFLVFLASLALDLAIGEPPTFIHPVVAVGRLSSIFVRPYAGKLHGVILWFVSVIPVFTLCLLPLLVPNVIVKFLLLTLVLKTTFSIKMLYKIVRESLPLDERSRSLVQQIVRRDLSKSDQGHIASAAIESLFESLVDGITSPIFWFLLLGLPGALIQRFANTMDSMVGYKVPELKEEGYFSAKVDTLLNYVPARLTVLLMGIAGFLLWGNFTGAFRYVKESPVESVNARYPIGAAAGILGVRLEKQGSYSVGEGNLPTSMDVERALVLFKMTLVLYIVFILVCYYYLYGLSLFGYPYGLLELF